MTAANSSLSSHWDQVYQQKSEEALSWTQGQAMPSIELIQECRIKKDDSVLDVGSGKSVLIRDLLNEGYTNVIANDISTEALEQQKRKLGNQAQFVRWIVDDLAHPQELPEVGPVAIWHDRAVLHFLTDFKERLTYFALMNQMVQEEGYVIIGAFNEDAPQKCSGIEVRHYNEDKLREFMGPGYKLLKSLTYDHESPGGDHRPYVYGLFQKIPGVETR